MNRSDELLKALRQELKDNSDPVLRESGKGFFKEEVKLYGMRNVTTMKIGKRRLSELRNMALSKTEIFALCEDLWQSGYNEECYIACQWADSLKKQFVPEDFEVFADWVERYVSNWATCDTLCNHTVGDIVSMYPELADELLNWTRSDNRWVKRAAAVTLIVPARHGEFIEKVFEISDALLTDPDDMVRKGYGWLLKSASESHEAKVWQYVMERKNVMPRVSLRYAIEKMPKELRAPAMIKQKKPRRRKSRKIDESSKSNE
ncbi:MAG: DNA alkylation repair protein [Clostridiales Family XIII bacterium]|jgi:3-methyladenine DNA glycosylase AlkD|nr:DNA alkylation repair protein [Clostridiales Family XIII bacterium]